MKKNNILISIIVPIYNTSEYLEKCLNSILNQTIKEIEVICINDGSTDISLEILKKYQKKDNRIIIINQTNKGVSAARNAGLDIAKGKYIGFVDSDDYITPDMYKEMYNKIIKYQTDIVVCNYYTDKNNSISIRSNKKDYIIKTKSKYIKELLEDDNIQNYVWSRLYKKELFSKVRFREGRLLEDIYLSIELIDKIKTAYYISKPLYYYRNRNNSITNINNVETINDAIFSYYERYCIIKNKYKSLIKQNLYSMLKWLTCFKRCFSYKPLLFYIIYNKIIKEVINDYKKTDLTIYSNEEMYNEIIEFIEYYN